MRGVLSGLALGAILFGPASGQNTTSDSTTQLLQQAQAQAQAQSGSAGQAQQGTKGTKGTTGTKG